MDTTGPAQLSRRYNLPSGLLYNWKKQYARGKLDNGPTQVAALLDRINKLDQHLQNFKGRGSVSLGLQDYRRC